MRWRTFRRAEEGASAVEFALIAPVLLALIAGTYELGSHIRMRTTIQGIAQQMATSWAACRKTEAECNAELAQFTTAIPILAPHLPWTEVVSWSGSERVRLRAGRFQLRSAAPASGHSVVVSIATADFTPYNVVPVTDTWQGSAWARPVPFDQTVVQVMVSMEYRSQIFREFADRWWDSNCQNEDCEANEIWASGTALAPRS